MGAPASLPGGSALRDAVMAVCERAAANFSPVPSLGSDWLLEFVLGRIARYSPGSVDDLVRTTLRGKLPNRCHMLLALHLTHGGKQATVNLDDCIERAYALLTGRQELPHHAPAVFHETLPLWRAAAGRAQLRVAISEEDFGAYHGAGTILCKLHGGLRGKGEYSTVVEAVLSDEQEQVGLSCARRASLRSMVAAGESVAVVGYRGNDIDVYGPLLDVSRDLHVVWAAYEVDPSVIADLDSLSARIHFSDAEPILEELVGPSPPWPSRQLSAGSLLDAVGSWSARVEQAALAEAFARMLVDARRYDEAIDLAAAIVRATHGRRARLIFGDALNHRGSDADKRASARVFLRLALSSHGDDRIRGLIRFAESHRSLANRGAGRLHLALALFSLVGARALAVRGSDAVASDAEAALGQTFLRVAETAPKFATAKRTAQFSSYLANRFLSRALAVPRGERGVYTALQRTEIIALSTLLAAKQLPKYEAELLLSDLAPVRSVYERVPNLRGLANERAARALVLAAAARFDEALNELSQALERYATEPLDASGIGLVERRLALIEHAVAHRGGCDGQ
jgi:hypothetical protein